MRTLELNPPETDRLRTAVERAVLGRTDVRALLRNRPKPVLPARSAQIAGRVSFNPSASAGATLVEIVAEDRPGLLYDLASAISASGGNIEVVLIDTQGHRAIDVFYVTVKGRKPNEEEQRALGEALRRALAPARG
jgi:[protein-PII] uridylyltransferase